MRRVISGLAMLLLAAPLWGQEPAQTGMTEHRVERGETLRGLALRYLQDPDQWKAIYEANTSRISDPDLILPGQVLMIPTGAAAAAGPTARISIRQGAEPSPLGAPVTARPAPTQPSQGEPVRVEPARVEPARAGNPEAPRRTGLAFGTTGSRPYAPQDPNRTVFYRQRQASSSSNGPTVLSEVDLDRPAVRPGEYASAPWIGNPADLRVMGTFLRSVRTDPSAWGGPVSSHPRDRVFIRYTDGARPEPGSRLVVVDVGRPIHGAGENARVVAPRGVVVVSALDADAIEAHVDAQFGPIMPGQLVIPEIPMPELAAGPAEPVSDGADLEGRILGFGEVSPLHDHGDLAFISVGASDGVQLGDIFLAYIPARDAGVEASDNRTLPPEPVAELRVVRVAEGSATVRLDHISLPRLEDGLPVRRIRRMR